MQMDPCQGFTIGPKALDLAFLMIPERLGGAKKCHGNGLKLFGCLPSLLVQSCSFIAREISVIYAPEFQSEGSALMADLSSYLSFILKIVEDQCGDVA